MEDLAAKHTPEAPSKDLLRFLTCGSVDDGKSTLIGRMLHDTKLIFEDKLSELAKDLRRCGTTGDDVDFALLLDGREAERGQDVTIDVAYRFFSTPRRSFIVADTPDHEQYTRNMAAGASTAQLAVILIDGRKGVLAQTKRHSYICSLLGVRHIVVAVNKMELIDYRKESFERIVGDYLEFASQFDFTSIIPIPVSARYGDNVIERSGNTPWYRGPSLLGHLEAIDIGNDTLNKPFRFRVQWVNRPNLDFRGYAGTVDSGRIAKGDAIVVATSGKQSRVSDIVTYDGSLEVAEAGDAVTLTLADEVDVSRGDVLVSPTARPEVSDQFAAHIIWMDDEPLMPGRSYLARAGAKTVPLSITAIKYKIDVNTRERLAANTLKLNEIAFCNIATGVPVAFDSVRRESQDRRLPDHRPLQ